MINAEMAWRRLEEIGGSEQGQTRISNPALLTGRTFLLSFLHKSHGVDQISAAQADHSSYRPEEDYTLSSNDSSSHRRLAQ